MKIKNFGNFTYGMKLRVTERVRSINVNVSYRGTFVKSYKDDKGNTFIQLKYISPTALRLNKPAISIYDINIDDIVSIEDTNIIDTEYKNVNSKGE